MFVVQLGAFAWLSDIIPVTSSGRHAQHFPTEAAAQAAIATFDANRPAALAHMEPAQRTYYRLASEVPVVIVPLEELNARLEAMGYTRRPSFATPGLYDDGADQAALIATDTTKKRGTGITAAIYQWVKDHPQATKAEAQAAFPSANRSTLSVQFSAARREA